MVRGTRISAPFVISWLMTVAGSRIAGPTTASGGRCGRWVSPPPKVTIPRCANGQWHCTNRHCPPPRRSNRSTRAPLSSSARRRFWAKATIASPASWVNRFASELAALVAAERRPDWAWFEIVLAYDNCRLPEALIAAGRALDRDDWVGTGLSTLDWIAEKQTSERGLFRPVGHESFGREYAEPLPFDQQPLEAWATIDACAAALTVSGDAKWRDRALSAWRWYLGDNDVGVALADPETGECFDGLHPTCVNRNRGAESILSFQLAAQAMAAIVPLSNRALHLAAA